SLALAFGKKMLTARVLSLSRLLPIQHEMKQTSRERGRDRGAGESIAGEPFAGIGRWGNWSRENQPQARGTDRRRVERAPRSRPHLGERQRATRASHIQ